MLGPVCIAGTPAAEIHDAVWCDGYVRLLVSYEVPSSRASAFVSIPDELDRRQRLSIPIINTLERCISARAMSKTFSPCPRSVSTY